MTQSLRRSIRTLAHADEPLVVESLLAMDVLDADARAAIRADAMALVERCRTQSHKAGTLDAFLQEFGLSNKEGIALMCLAEALLRVPDRKVFVSGAAVALKPPNVTSNAT